MTNKILLIKTKGETDFFDYDGYVFGDDTALIGADYSVNLSKIFGVSDKLSMLSGVTVVYCSEMSFAGETYISAVLRDAVVYRYFYHYDPNMREIFLQADAAGAYVIPEDKRKFRIKMNGGCLYVENRDISRYIDEISVDEFCVRYDDTAIQRGLDEAGNDAERLKDLFDDVFYRSFQTRKSKPVIDRLRKICRDDRVKYDYADYLFFNNRYAEALTLFGELYNAGKTDDATIARMGVCNFDMNYNSNAMNFFDMLSDKSILNVQFRIDYDYIKKNMPYINNAEYVDDKEILKYPVSLPLDEMKLPDTVRVDGTTKYFCPVRKKGVPITPEERVRQQVLRYMLEVCRVPAENITSEDSLAHYDRGNVLRADITVNAGGKTLLLVECKENGVIIDGDPLRQILEYQSVVNSRYLLLTNGITSYIYRAEDDGSFTPLSGLPDFEGMCRLEGVSVPISNMTTARPDVSEFNDEEIENYRNDGQYLGMNTPDSLAPAILNLAWFFLDTSYKMEGVTGYGIEIVKDLGIIYTIVSNASGGTYPGQYRQLLVKDRFGQEQLVCFSVFGTWADENRGGYTSLVCGIEIDGKLLSKLQIRLDKFLIPVSAHKYRIEHNGVRSRKSIDSMLSYVRSECPQLLDGNSIYLGELDNSGNITIHSSGAKDFAARLVSYLILRKELAQKEAKNSPDSEN